MPPNAPLIVPPLLVIMALPAFEVLTNRVTPPLCPETVLPLLVKEVMLPAVALFVNVILPWLIPLTKFCVIPELFVMPVPLMVNKFTVPGLTVIVKALAPELNVIPDTVTPLEIETPVVLETSKVATSDGPLGTVADDQFVPVFQTPVAGLRSHVPLPAKVALCIESKSNVAVATSNDVRGFLEKLNLVFMLIFHWPTATPQTLWARMLEKCGHQVKVLKCDAAREKHTAFMG
jgi:hypothetical protein